MIEKNVNVDMWNTETDNIVGQYSGILIDFNNSTPPMGIVINKKNGDIELARLHWIHVQL